MAEQNDYGPNLVKKLRQVVDPPGVKGTWMRKLSDRQLFELFQRLIMGHSVYKLVQIVQLDWQIMRTSDPKSLARAVRHFRDSLLTDIEQLQAKAKSKQEKQVAAGLDKKAQKVASKINVMEILARAISIQHERVEMLHEKEQKALPFKHTDNAQKVLTEMCREFVEIGIKLGATKSHEQPQEMIVNINHQFTQMMKVIGDDKPQALEVLDNFMAKAQAEAELLEVDQETGEYRVVPKKMITDGHN